MGRGYGQYCPLALATELLGARWTILVVSRLLLGCSRFNEIHRSLPQISPSLLSRRLSELAEAGLVEKVASRDRSHDYVLTEAGRELGPVVDQLLGWGQKWARDMTLDDLDPAFLVWAMHAQSDRSKLPAGQIVIEFRFTGSPTNCRRFWLVCMENVEMCLKDPGLEIDVAVRSDLRLFVEAWRGIRCFRTEVTAGRIEIDGPKPLVDVVPDFLLGNVQPPQARRRPGRERRIATASTRR